MGKGTVDLFLMSPPHPQWAIRARANFRSREAAPVDARTARREWLALALAIERLGGTVVALEAPSPELTGMPYAAECGQIVPREGRAPLFILPRMAHAHRRAERDHWERLARAMGMACADPGAGTWEAQGDVAHFDGCTLLFHGGRTDRAGMEGARRLMEEAGALGEVLEVEVREPAFHGNMALLAVPAVDRMLVCPSVVSPASMAALRRRFGAERLIEVSEDEIRNYATNALPVGRTLLTPSVAPERVLRLLSEAGMEICSLSMKELCEKGGGASRCLVSWAAVPEGSVHLPEENRLSSVARSIESAGGER